MKKLRLYGVGLFLLVSCGCTLNRESAKRRFLEKGNQHYAAGNYEDASVEYRNALRKDQNFGEAYYRLGLAEIKRNNMRRAAGALSRAIQLMPDHAEAKKQLADLYMNALLVTANPADQDALREQVRQLAQTLLDRDPNSYDGLRIMGHLQAQAGETDKAIATLSKTNDLRPGQPDIVMPLVQMLTLANRFPEAEKLASSFLDATPSYAPLYDFLYLHYLGANQPAQAERILRQKADRNPNQPLALVQLAGHYFKTGKTAEAEATVKPLLDNPSAVPGAMLAVADYYAASGRYDEAKRALQRGEQAEPKSKADYRLRLAIVLRAEGKEAEAVTVVDGLLKEDPENESLLAARASLARSTNDPNQIEASVTQFRSLVEKSPNNAILRYNLGQSLLARGDIEGAMQEFRAASRSARNYLAPLGALAELSLRLQRYDDLKDSTSKILAVQPRNERARLLKAVALAGKDDLQTARFELNALLKEKPDYPEAQLELAMLNARERRFKEAELGFRKFYKPGSQDLRVLTSLASLLVNQGKLREAEQLVDNEIKSNPNRTGLLWMKAYLQIQAGNYPGALNSLEQEARQSPKNPRVPALQGQLSADQGRLNEAITYYRKALQLAPEDPGNLNNVAFHLAEAGQNLDEALSLIQKARKIAPKDSNTLDTFGYIQLLKGDKDGAIATFSQLVRAEPENPIYRYHMGRALLEKGDRARAKVELEAALAAKPTPRDQARIRELLAKAS